MRKLSLFLSVFLISVSVAFSQSLATTTFSVANGNLPVVGSTFNVPVNVAGFPSSLRYIEVVLQFDNSVLSYVSPVINLQHPSFPAPTVSFPSTNVIKINYNNVVTPFNVFDGKLFDIQFNYLGGDSPLTFDPTCKYRVGSTITYITNFTHGSVIGSNENAISSGLWGTAGGWSLGVVPTALQNVTVNPGGTVVIDAAAVCNNLTVASGGQLTLNAGKTLTVNGNMEIASGGSFIQNGTLGVTGSTTAKRFIAGANWSLGTDGWHLLSSPVANQAISGSFTVPNYDFYAWNEPTLQWYNQKIGSHGINTFNVGQGYLVAYETSGTKEFVGTLNTADKSVNLTKSGSGATTSYGFNLLGNPYPSALTWATGWTLGNVNAVAKIWNSTGKSYSDIAAGNPIPAMNGFMVYTTANQALTIPAAARVHSSTAWYKSSDQQIKLIANDPEGASYQPSIIKFIADATTGFDLEYDSYMLTGFAPNFYSIADNSSFSLNALPEASSGLTIPFGFVKNASSNFNIELAESIDGYIIYLRDLKTNTVVNLSEKISYSFISEEGDDAKRFELFFGVLGVDNLDKLAAAAVYNVDNKIVVTNVSGKTKMDVYNVQGQLLNNYEFFSNGNHEISVNLPTGIYMVRLSNGGEMKTMKVIVK